MMDIKEVFKGIDCCSMSVCPKSECPFFGMDGKYCTCKEELAWNSKILNDETIKYRAQKYIDLGFEYRDAIEISILEESIDFEKALQEIDNAIFEGALNCGYCDFNDVPGVIWAFENDVKLKKNYFTKEHAQEVEYTMNLYLWREYMEEGSWHDWI